MYYETEKNDHGLPYNPIKACVVPRPIGWITSINADGMVNAAPYSFFNILSYSPPYVLFSAGGHAEDQKEKDSVANVRATGEFVYNMATWDQREQMNNTGLIVDRTVDEMAETGLEPLPSKLVAPPRIKGAPVHLECRLHQIVELPGHDAMSNHHAVFGVVVGVHIADDAITEDGIFDVARYKPLSRLGYKDYAWTDESVIFQMEKRTPEEEFGKRQQAAE
jgi:flavin reductase (DIM6/NTAB) family NADH-FMN oxidoreductase RutF